MKALIYIISFFFISHLALAQDKVKVDSLKKLGRDALIKLAVKEINDPGFDISAYDRIVVKADSTKILVCFDISVLFKSKKACFYNSVDVALNGSGTMKSSQGSCKETKYYKVSPAMKKKIDFVFQSINKENEIGDIPDRKMIEGATMEITENADHYYIEVSDWSTYSHYKIQKESGKIYEAGHKHYDRREEEPESRYEIIK